VSNQNGEAPAKFLRDEADARDNLGQPIVLGVAHIEPENSGALVDQLLERLRFARRAERANDFGSAHQDTERFLGSKTALFIIVCTEQNEITIGTRLEYAAGHSILGCRNAVGFKDD
jgi:hypothetical protein